MGGKRASSPRKALHEWEQWVSLSALVAQYHQKEAKGWLLQHRHQDWWFAPKCCPWRRQTPTMANLYYSDQPLWHRTIDDSHTKDSLNSIYCLPKTWTSFSILVFSFAWNICRQLEVSLDQASCHGRTVPWQNRTCDPCYTSLASLVVLTDCTHDITLYMQNKQCWDLYIHLKNTMINKLKFENLWLLEGGKISN